MKMTSFETFFRKSKGKPIEYKGSKLILADKFPVSNNEKLLIQIKETNSESRQGLSVDITGSCECENEIYKKGKGINMIFWEDTAPKNIVLTIFTKENFVWIKNIWESYSLTGYPSTDSGNNGAAMIVEEIENGKLYKCNDGYPDEDFNDIIFAVQKIK